MWERMGHTGHGYTDGSTAPGVPECPLPQENVNGEGRQSPLPRMPSASSSSGTSCWGDGLLVQPEGPLTVPGVPGVPRANGLCSWAAEYELWGWVRD